MCSKPLGASLCGPRTARGLWPGLDVAVNVGGGGGVLPTAYFSQPVFSQRSGRSLNISPPDQFLCSIVLLQAGSR